MSGLSDHEALFLTLHLTPTTNKDNHTNFIRNINNSTVYDYQMKLSYENWEPVFNSDGINASFNVFFNIFLRHFYSSFPLIQVRKFKPNLWITLGILAACRRKRVLYSEVRKSNNPLFLKHYKDYWNILTKVIDQAKRMSYNKQVLNSTNRIRTTWKILNRETHKKVKKDCVQTICIDGRNTNNLYNIVEAFNSYFKKTADNIHNKMKANSKPVSLTDNGEDYMAYMDKAFGSPFPKIQISKTTSVEIERIIKSLKSSCTYGYDEISNYILKACKTFISAPLSYSCNRILFEVVFPDGLKYAIIIPVFKKGDRKDLSNYRPKTILTSFNKIFEKVMYSRLVQHLNDHNILSKYQYGFRAKLGTDNAIFNLITGILHSLNHKSMVDGVFCDREKASDCVSHEVLLNKLKFYGIIDI
jgi:hypothetical protein